MTDNEARRYGRFLLGLLETVMNWHSDAGIFEAECANHPGFLTVFRNALNTYSPNFLNKQEQLDYENFRHVCHKWHYKLTKSFIVCLESEEYLQMRNSLIILTKILPQFPKLVPLYSVLEKRVEKIKTQEKDKRQDIFTLASAYLGQLKQRKSLMVEEAKFHLKEQVAQSSSDSTSKSTRTDSFKFKQPLNPSKPTASQTTDSKNSQVNGTSASKQPSASSSQNSTTQQQQTSSQSSTSSKDTSTTIKSRFILFSNYF